MGIKIITDSICDVPKEYADRYGIRVMPLTINFSNKSYIDGIDLTLEDFLGMLEKAEALPTTSQVTPVDFLEVLGRKQPWGIRLFQFMPLHN